MKKFAQFSEIEKKSLIAFTETIAKNRGHYYLIDTAYIDYDGKMQVITTCGLWLN